MIIKMLETIVDLGESPISAEEIMHQIHILMEAAQMAFDGLVVDGIEVVDEYQTFLNQNWDRIKVIELKVKTMDQFIYDNLQDALDYIQRAIPEIKILSDEFYRGANKLAWHKFEQLLEGLQWLTEICSMVQRQHSDNSDPYQEIVIKMLAKLGELGEALEKLDQILIGDLILYEILPVLEELDFQLKISLEFGKCENVN